MESAVYQYIVKRLFLMIPTLIGAAILVFFLLRLIPGDICELRMLHLCVAVAKIESWYLADGEAIRSVIRGVEYDAREYDPRWAKKKLGELHVQVGTVYNSIDFGERIAPKFDPQRAAERSPSFRFAWNRISNAASRGEESPLFPS